MAKGPQRQQQTKKQRVGLVFCEDENDAEALSNLARALRPSLPPIMYCRRPLVLMRDRKAAEDRKRNAAGVLAVVRARERLANVHFVIAHQDCDALEPAHKALASQIECELKAQGVPNVIAVAPAWEIEAWWYLWPDAVAGVNSKWKPLKRTGNHGMIKDVKEVLRRDLRSPGARDYEESDSRRISKTVMDKKLVGTKKGTSNSFEEFSARVLSLPL